MDRVGVGEGKTFNLVSFFRVLCVFRKRGDRHMIVKLKTEHIRHYEFLRHESSILFCCFLFSVSFVVCLLELELTTRRILQWKFPKPPLSRVRIPKARKLSSILFCCFLFFGFFFSVFIGMRTEDERRILQLKFQNPPEVTFEFPRHDNSHLFFYLTFFVFFVSHVKRPIFCAYLLNLRANDTDSSDANLIKSAKKASFVIAVSS